MLELAVQPLMTDSYLLLAGILFGIAIIVSILIGLLDVAFYLLVAAAIVLAILGVYSMLFGVLIPVQPGVESISGVFTLG